MGDFILNISVTDLFYPMQENRAFFLKDRTHCNESGRCKQMELILVAVNLI